jgi:hypothetical protein
VHNFTQRIAIEHGFNPEFFFNRIYTVQGFRYFISVLDQKRNTHNFSMEDKGEHWEIIDPSKVPGWIKKVEPQLNEAVQTNLRR